MNQIIPFNYGDNLIRVVNDEESGEPLWVAQDVCAVLEYKEVSKTVAKLDEDEKLTRKFFVSGQNRDMMCVTESGLYTLILRSNKPEAKPFKRWVTHEVLPSIRKTGSYGTESFDLSRILSIMENQTRILEHISMQNTVMLSLMDRLSKYEESIHMGFRMMSGQTDRILNSIGNGKEPIIYFGCHSRVKISTSQRSALSELVSERARCLSELYKIQPNVISTSLYVGLKSRFGVIYYGDIYAADYDDAVMYIENFDIGR